MKKEEVDNDESEAIIAALDLLTRKGKNRKGTVNPAIVARHDMPTITIPKDMTKREAAEELKRQWEEEETVIDVSRRFEGWKWQDVLVAISITAKSHFGWINAVQSFMNPPTEIQVVIDYKNGSPVKTTCFYGQFKVTALEAGICDIGVSGGIVGISFNLKKKYKGEVERWYELIDQHLRTNSIYKGKSVAVTEGGGRFGGEVEFEIIETRPNPKIVLNPKEKSVLEQYCTLDLKEKGKRTYLFTGPYGNGKSEGAMMLGEAAKKEGMVFFYCKSPDAFIPLLLIAAKYYTPALLFLEDIDEVGSGSDRTHEINELLNTLDGVETKNKNLKVLFTTNHHGRINPALRRPGRLDLIVKFENPDKETTAEIYRRYFDGELGRDRINFEEIAAATPDCSGAFIAEICKRSVRLGELGGGISNDIVIAAINSIKDHLDLMTEPVEESNALEAAFEVISSKMAENINGFDSSVLTKPMQALGSQLSQVHSDLAKRVGGAAKDIQDRVLIVDDKTTRIKAKTDKL